MLSPSCDILTAHSEPKGVYEKEIEAEIKEGKREGNSDRNEADTRPSHLTTIAGPLCFRY
jgi:hypothetical protein